MATLSAEDAKLNRLVAAQLCKTKMCAMFARGTCYDVKCRFAHSQHELRSPPNLTKTAICRLFSRGQCNDAKCKFAHGEQELRVTPSVYKTQLCNFFDRGHCKKGDRCRHAHGKEELRSFQGTDQRAAQSAPENESQHVASNKKSGGNKNQGDGISNAAPASAPQMPVPLKSPASVQSLGGVAEQAHLGEVSPLLTGALTGAHDQQSLSPASSACLSPPSPVGPLQWPTPEAGGLTVTPGTPTQQQLAMFLAQVATPPPPAPPFGFLSGSSSSTPEKLAVPPLPTFGENPAEPMKVQLPSSVSTSDPLVFDPSADGFHAARVRDAFIAREAAFAGQGNFQAMASYLARQADSHSAAANDLQAVATMCALKAQGASLKVSDRGFESVVMQSLHPTIAQQLSGSATPTPPGLEVQGTLPGRAATPPLDTPPKTPRTLPYLDSQSSPWHPAVSKASTWVL